MKIYFINLIGFTLANGHLALAYVFVSLVVRYTLLEMNLEKVIEGPNHLILKDLSPTCPISD